MSNPSTEFLEFPETTKLQAGMTYVVRKDHPVIKDNASIPADVTIIFMGGILTPYTDPQKPVQINYTLKGNKTKIVAPITQIFAENLTIDGSWEIDRAYPQWFGAKSYSDKATLDSSQAIDSSDAINKAIVMKETGEVFLSRGIYRVDKTIFVKFGIILTGESGGGYNNEEKNLSTILAAGATNSYLDVGSTGFKDGYFMMVNVTSKGGSWNVGWTNPGTVIKNLFFTNEYKEIKRLKGIYSLGNIEINTCLWKYYQQAVYTGRGYYDQEGKYQSTYSRL